MRVLAVALPYTSEPLARCLLRAGVCPCLFQLFLSLRELVRDPGAEAVLVCGSILDGHCEVAHRVLVEPLLVVHDRKKMRVFRSVYSPGDISEVDRVVSLARVEAGIETGQLDRARSRSGHHHEDVLEQDELAKAVQSLTGAGIAQPYNLLLQLTQPSLVSGLRRSEFGQRTRLGLSRPAGHITCLITGICQGLAVALVFQAKREGPTARISVPPPQHPQT
ncbi:hypothetical protein [Streptomyces sp. NPDC046862]|uniref:hypothetical protein n=1 Tax=Streptomyces sp. NPDC046862 TaxID=3154603 RepID=UPI0034537BB2